jgi:hypothetical protein
MAIQLEEKERVPQLMEAANAVAALAARVGYDREYSAQLVRAAHANEPREIERLLAIAGVSGTASIAQQRQVFSIHLDIGPLHVSIDVSKSK